MRRIDLGQWAFGRGRRNTPFLVLAAVVMLALLPLNIAAFNPITPATRNPGNTSGSFQGVPSRNPITILPGTQEPVVQFRPFELTPSCTPSSANDMNYSASYYMKYDLTSASNAGQASAQRFANAGRDCAVILDMGQAATDPNGRQGVYSRPSNTFAATDIVVSLATTFIFGYMSVAPAPTSHTTLILGLNLLCRNPNACTCPDKMHCSCPSAVICIVDDFSLHGAAWATAVQQVNLYVQATYGPTSHITVQAGADIETGYNTSANSRTWITGFEGASSTYLMYDYGDAGGCPPFPGETDPSVDYDCNNGWKQSDVWYVSWGAVASEAFPEIYFDTPSPSLAAQWAQISQVGQIQKGQSITFKGVLTQFIKCQNSNFTIYGCNADPPANTIHTIAPYTALTDLQGATNQTVIWSSDIIDAP